MKALRSYSKTFVDLITSSDLHYNIHKQWHTHTHPNNKRGRLCMWEIGRGREGSSVVGVVYNLSPCQTQTIVFTHRKSQLLSVYFTNLHPFYRNKVPSKEIYRYCFVSPSTNEKKTVPFTLLQIKQVRLSRYGTTKSVINSFHFRAHEYKFMDVLGQPLFENILLDTFGP